MELEFAGPVVHWRGPAPWYFVPVPDAECAQRRVGGDPPHPPLAGRRCRSSRPISVLLSDGGYLVPVKADVRRAEGLEEGDVARVRLELSL